MEVSTRKGLQIYSQNNSKMVSEKEGDGGVCTTTLNVLTKLADHLRTSCARQPPLMKSLLFKQTCVKQLIH